MESTTPSFSSSQGTLLPEDHVMYNTSPTYSSPVRPTSNHSSFPQSTDGLGISFCGMESPFSQLQACQPPDPYTFSAPGCPDYILSTEPLYETALDVGPLSPATCYESYSGHTDVSASPLSFYSTHALSASPTYSSVMDFGGTCDGLPAQLPAGWPTTPTIKVEENMDNCWDQPLFAEGRPVNKVPALPQMHRFTAVHNSQIVGRDDNDRLLKLEPKVERAASHSPRSPVYDPVPDVPIKVEEEMEPLRKENIPSANGLQCTVCGYRFTRRSNCREHMKRHDPSRKKTHPCGQCERLFGRRSDLQRHVDSIHRGLRKYGCDLCGRRFTRQDTLSRHRGDGCDRKTRKIRGFAKRDETNVPDAQALPSPSASPENNKHPVRSTELGLRIN
ncbi:hypothetical protein ASPWEDRAFT_27098 [Aspergillus wentii DTO 134E9]|uniref:C2H2-type domain-containing protein n=1 Tax=Aspergillus wentii DTO 134E9 TaxID=1073089 RepID=A0A1L9RS08_ASPWE|nr:uncharacterized protein ASPWEDRAFT_27098 [Aspergillus wentii DTO 134E9]KAI9930578.1 hypothetical protein MW887_011332 [Aspergillus wentii]OJJ37740.1 hypothetical protein ASPWEDRAFT_27098 [Aspergillus wentii DTO 134E9]